MSLPFRGRRPDQWSSPHDRARALAAERLGGPLEGSEASWLDDHLAACAECRAVADTYRSQQAELWALADHQPVPPRDLWARTAAAIEREAAAGQAASVAGNASYRRVRASALPLGAISGLLVIVVVVGASLLSQRTIVLPPAQQSQSVALGSAPSPNRTSAPGPTPIDVAADVSYWKLGGGGTVDAYKSQITKVCPGSQGAGCPPLEEPSPQAIALPDLPSSVSKAPNNDQFVVVDSNTKGAGGGVFVVSPPTSAPSPSASPSLQPTPSPTPSETPVTPSATPSIDTSPPLVATAAPTASPSEPVASPSLPPASPSVSPSAPPGALQIARDVIVVGESEAYSPDGTWFAFTARPADGSHGPDIYVWRPGDAEARPITTDHRSMFAAWLDNQILASRAVDVATTPAASAAPRTFQPVVFLVDPATGKEKSLPGLAAWRPAVDPTRSKAVYWDGSLQLDASGVELRPAEGRLVLGPWSAGPSDIAGEPGASGAAPASAAPPAATSEANASSPADPSGPAVPSGSGPANTPASAAPSPSAQAFAPIEIAGGQIRDWDARWDETGTHLAVWLADVADPRVGLLTLYLVDPASGAISAAPKVHDLPALAGFSIGKGRLAWVTPRQNGEGSRITVAAWKKDSVGSVETRQSSEEVVVVR
ncbi:MAG: zf-HC2 domain-containing protein [Chloroflexota bacterium]|nr:zf-HC2 domain-containing protein [Chloroflexota bacterium]